MSYVWTTQTENDFYDIISPSFSSLVETPMFKGELKCFELNLETTLISLKSTWEILHKR